MSKVLDDALEHLTTTYQSLAQAALGYREVLDVNEIMNRLDSAIPDTAEYIALQQLALLLQTDIVDVTPAPQQMQTPTAPQQPLPTPAQDQTD
jgi:hypothetical protein